MQEQLLLDGKENEGQTITQTSIVVQTEGKR